MARSESAVHRTIVVVDIEGFGDPRRTLPHQLRIRSCLYRMLAQALQATDMRWEDCYHEDRGDSHPHTSLGQYQHARAAWQEALELYHRQGRHSDAKRVQQQLDTLGPS